MMIEVENLSKYFGPVFAVRNVSFQVEHNEIVGLLGNNGAGENHPDAHPYDFSARNQRHSKGRRL